MNKSNRYGLNEVINDISEIILEDISMRDYKKATDFLKGSLYEISFKAYQRNLDMCHSLKNIARNCPVPYLKKELEQVVEKQLEVVEKNKSLLLGLYDNIDKVMARLQTQLNDQEEN